MSTSIVQHSDAEQIAYERARHKVRQIKGLYVHASVYCILWSDCSWSIFSQGGLGGSSGQRAVGVSGSRSTPSASTGLRHCSVPDGKNASCAN